MIVTTPAKTEDKVLIYLFSSIVYKEEKAGEDRGLNPQKESFQSQLGFSCMIN